MAIAKEQGARSFGLQAALTLAQLYQSTGRASDAYAALAPALERFSPTPEMPRSPSAGAAAAAAGRAWNSDLDRLDGEPAHVLNWIAPRGAV